MDNDDFPEEHIAILREFGISDGILYEYPSVAKLCDAIINFRIYAAWVVRTNNGDRLELIHLKPASGEVKTIPKRHFDDNQ